MVEPGVQHRTVVLLVLLQLPVIHLVGGGLVRDQAPGISMGTLRFSPLLVDSIWVEAVVEEWLMVILEETGEAMEAVAEEGVGVLAVVTVGGVLTPAVVEAVVAAGVSMEAVMVEGVSVAVVVAEEVDMVRRRRRQEGTSITLLFQGRILEVWSLLRRIST